MCNHNTQEYVDEVFERIDRGDTSGLVVGRDNKGLISIAMAYCPKCNGQIMFMRVGELKQVATVSWRDPLPSTRWRASREVVAGKVLHIIQDLLLGIFKLDVEGIGEVKVGSIWFELRQPKVGHYFVRDDGGSQWIFPPDMFESTYKRI